MPDPITAEIVLNAVLWVAAGYAPFLVAPVSPTHWMVTGRDGHNCVAHPKDGLRAVFDSEQTANLLCQELNGRAAA